MTSTPDNTAMDQELEQEGAELERQLVAYVKKLEVRYNSEHNVALSISINTWFEPDMPLRVQWMSKGNSVSGHSLYDVAAVCLPVPAGTYLFRRTETGTCPTLVDGKVEWR